MIESFGWIIFAISTAGLYFNVKKDPRCFALWSITNFAWIIIDVSAGIYSQAATFVLNEAFALWGLWHWWLRDWLRSQKHL